MLGRDVLVAEPPGLGLGQLDDALGARIERQRAALDAGAPGQDRGQLAAERRAGRRRGGGASRPGCRRPARRARTGCAPRRGWGCRGAAAVAWAATIASWAFWVNRSSCIRVSGAGVGVRRVSEDLGWSTRSKKALRGRLRLGGRGRSAERPGPSRTGRRVRRALKRGMPWPVSRNVRPGWVPAGILSRTLPLSVSTLTSAPRSASSSVSGSSRSRSAPRRVNRASGSTRTTTKRSPPPGPWPAQPDPRAGVGAARDRDLETLAVDLDQAGRAVVGLLEADLGVGLVGRRRPRRPAPPDAPRTRPAGRPARRCPSREDVLEAQSDPSVACRAPVRTAARPAAALGVLAEEHPEEVGELARVAGRVELVADVAARPCRRSPPNGLPAPAPARCACTADLLPVRPELVVLLALRRDRRGPRWPR